MKDVKFVGTALDDLKRFPGKVRKNVGYALHLIQVGEMPHNAKVLKGFGGAKVLEIKESLDKNTYRAVYTIKIKNYVFVLHCFQKKSNKGIRTNKKDINLIKERLKEIELLFE